MFPLGLKTEVPLIIGGATVPPGEYSLFIDLKQPTQWILIVSSWGAAPRIDPSIKDAIYGSFGYTPDKDVARAPMKVDTLPYRVEELTWQFLDVTDDGEPHRYHVGQIDWLGFIFKIALPVSINESPANRFVEHGGFMAQMTLKVNGKSRIVNVDPATPLLYVLRNDLELHGPRFGCGLAQCGACSVIMNGTAIRSCVTPVNAAQNRDITTLEGLGTVAKPHPLQAAFIEEQAAQCGYCMNGMIINAKVLLSTKIQARQTTTSRKPLILILCAAAAAICA